MALQRKDTMVSVRLPQDLVVRANYVVRNTPDPDISNRSSAIREALKGWLPEQERKIDAALGTSKAQSIPAFASQIKSIKAR